MQFTFFSFFIVHGIIERKNNTKRPLHIEGIWKYSLGKKERIERKEAERRAGLEAGGQNEGKKKWKYNSHEFLSLSQQEMIFTFLHFKFKIKFLYCLAVKLAWSLVSATCVDPILHVFDYTKVLAWQDLDGRRTLMVAEGGGPGSGS
jgi:hypothetical protein